jgi:hypothetical protein
MRPRIERERQREIGSVNSMFPYHPPDRRNGRMMLGIEGGKEKDLGSMSMKFLRIIAKLALLGILLDGSVWLLCCYLHFGTCLLRNLHNEVEKPVIRVQGNIMPWRNLATRE